MEKIKNLKRNTFVLIIITILVLYFVLKDDFNDISNILLKVDLKYIFIAVIFYFLYIAIRAYMIYITVANKKKFSLWESIKHNMITQFFNGITPFSTGGQPMEIYMLTKHKIRTARATNIILQNFLYYQIALVIYGAFAVLYNYFFNIFPADSLLKKLVILGFLINTIVCIILFLIACSEKFTKRCMKCIVFLLDKSNIIKNKEETKNKWMNRLQEFHNNTKSISKKVHMFVLGVSLNLISLTCLYIIPLFVLYSFHDFTSLNFINSIVTSAYVLLIGSFVPIPGASGGIEYGFLHFFNNFISGGMIVAVLLVWRIITYYVGVVVGAILLNFDKGVDDN